MGFELLDIAERFDAPFPSVARWEIGLEDAPAQILEALRGASGRAPSERANGVQNTLLEGDCLDLIKLIPDQSVHLVLCDLIVCSFGKGEGKWRAVRRHPESLGRR